MQAVWGIHDLINETMAAAAKTHRRTRRKSKLVTVAAFGGAGLVHAYGLARKLRSQSNRPAQRGCRLGVGIFHRAACFDLVRSHKTPLVGANLRMWKTYSARWKPTANAPCERQARQIKSRCTFGRGALYRTRLRDQPAPPR